MGQLRRQRAHSGRSYLEFLRNSQLSAGVYELPAGGVDNQQPHTEDEIYYVVAGAATARVAKEDQPVLPGAILFVPAGVEHRFHCITQDLTLLVFFAPAEGDRRGN